MFSQKISALAERTPQYQGGIGGYRAPIIAQFVDVLARRAKISIGNGAIQHLQLSEQPGLQFRRNPLGSDIMDKEGSHKMTGRRPR